MQADEPLGTFMDYCTYGYMIDNIVLIVTGTLHERDVQVCSLVSRRRRTPTASQSQRSVLPAGRAPGTDEPARASAAVRACRSCWTSVIRWACSTPSARSRWPPTCVSCTAWCWWTRRSRPTLQNPSPQVSSGPRRLSCRATHLALGLHKEGEQRREGTALRKLSGALQRTWTR